MILLFVMSMFVGCCAILWLYWDRFKKPRELHKKKIFISADCWLSVFDWLPRSQFGLGISMISHRFDFYVDEHFKTRKWKLGKIVIRRKTGENGANEIEFVNSDGLPIPQNPLPNKVIGFRSILIHYIDHNVPTFLRRFHRFFGTSATYLFITTENVRILEFVVLNLFPMLKDSIHEICFTTIAFRRMRQFVPSILCDFPSLRVVDFHGGILPEFPSDDSANASDGQAVTKWLFSPRHDKLPKLLKIIIENSALARQCSTTMEQIKAAFFNASSPVAFGIDFSFSTPFPIHFVVPFKLINEFTGEQLTLSKVDDWFDGLKLIRSPIEYERKWEKASQEQIYGVNNIGILIEDDKVGNGLLDASSVGPSGDH